MTYTAVDLGDYCNTGLSVLGDREAPPLGEQLFHGLPFRIQADPERCFISPAPRSPIRIALNTRFRYAIIAHRLLATGDGVGATVAEYNFTYADGESTRVAVRERFEIAVVPDPVAIAASPPSGAWGQLPFNARSDRPVGLQPRDAGPWGSAGRRQADVSSADVVPRGYFLWTWENPRPDARIDGITITRRGGPFAIAALTLSDADEYPFIREGARPVRVDFVDGARAEGATTEIAVDRGVVSFTQRALDEPIEDYLGDRLAGWGAPAASGRSRYAYVSAIPSATIRIESGSSTASVRWDELERDGFVRRGPFAIHVLEPSRNWIRTTVVDAETGTPIPARVHFRSADGIPYQPHGHHSHVNGDRETWNIDVGGDVRLGASSYAYIDGTCEGWLPRGSVVVDASQGFEYEPLRELVTIESGQEELTLRLKRWIDLNRTGWFSGDSHVHFLSTQGSLLEAGAEGLNVVNLLLSQWGSLFTNAEEFTGRPSVSRDGKTIVYASQENRQHFLGHLTLLGLKRPVMPWASDGPPEAEVGGTLETALAHWADACHAQGGTVVLPHLPVPNGEPAALIATGRVDAVEFLTQSEYVHAEYYRYLNNGYRLPLVAGTDKMSNEVPVGLYRTYVRIPGDEEFSYESWCRNLREGRTFITAGPIIGLRVDGLEIGDTVELPANGGTVEVQAWAESIFPLHTLQIVCSGEVVASSDSTAGNRRLELRERMTLKRGGWIAARAGGPGYTDSPGHRDVWNRGIIAHTSPIYVSCANSPELFDAATVQYMLTLIDGSLTHIRAKSLQYPPGTTTHWHGQNDHLEVLEAPFLEAREALHQRLHRHGIPH